MMASPLFRSTFLGHIGQMWSYSITPAIRLCREEGAAFSWFFLRVQNSVPGWLDEPGARFLYEMARDGPGSGAIVEIGSAWGRSTLYLARGSRTARREKVYAVDPHTGDPWYLAGQASAWYPPRVLGRYTGRVFGEPLKLRGGNASSFSSFDEFRFNLRRFSLADQVTAIVATSDDAAANWQSGPIRLLFIDGLHTYDGVRTDIENWVPKLVPGGVVVFDDYFNALAGVGVRRAVDELLMSGQVDPNLRRASRPYPGQLAWTVRC